MKLAAADASPSSSRAANDGHAAVSSAVSDWDASEEKRAHDAAQALAERVRAASEKELSKAWKVIEYERRVSTNLPEFSWNDPTNVVSASPGQTADGCWRDPGLG